MPYPLDYLQWLKEQPQGADVKLVKEALENGTVLRDHSDADIVLANFALTLMNHPKELAYWAPLIRRIALFNDHAYLDKKLNRKERLEAILGYYVMTAFEKLIPQKRPGGFDWAVGEVAGYLTLVRDSVHQMDSGENDPLGRFMSLLDDGNTIQRPKSLGLVLPFIKKEALDQKEVSDQLEGMLRDGQGISRIKDTLVVHFSPSRSRPNGMGVLRFVLSRTLPVWQGAKVLVVVGHEIKSDGVYDHVKIRSLDPSYDLTRLFEVMKTKRFPGGGRATAGGLYGPAGEKLKTQQSEANLTWLLESLE